VKPYKELQQRQKKIVFFSFQMTTFSNLQQATPEIKNNNDNQLLFQ
jgi:hypothetical protein